MIKLNSTFNKVMDIGQWILIVILGVGLYCTYTQNKKMGDDLVTNAVYDLNNERVIINESKTISQLRKENKELYDSIQSLKDVKSAMQIKWVYKYVGDTVYVDNNEQVKQPTDSTYHYSNETDTLSYDLTICGKDVKWHKLDLSLRDSLMIISRQKGNVNETKIIHSDPSTITTSTVFNKKDGAMKRVADRFYVGVGVGAGYGVINRQPDVYMGVNVGFKLW